MGCPVCEFAQFPKEIESVLESVLQSFSESKNTMKSTTAARMETILNLNMQFGTGAQSSFQYKFKTLQYCTSGDQQYNSSPHHIDLGLFPGPKMQPQT